MRAVTHSSGWMGQAWASATNRRIHHSLRGARQAAGKCIGGLSSAVTPLCQDHAKAPASQPLLKPRNGFEWTAARTAVESATAQVLIIIVNSYATLSIKLSK